MLVGEPVHVRPAREGLRVRDPDHADDLPEGGRVVRWSTYWEAQRRDGSVTTAPAPDAPADAD